MANRVSAEVRRQPVCVRRRFKWRSHKSESTDKENRVPTGTEELIVVMKPVKAGGAKEFHFSVLKARSTSKDEPY
jgi:hypothetical protein